ncbi:MAG TPA: type I restriction endonuclease, partial [Spirochaetota bacterium]|nr:type I restriction endonuclease [Spirochaetota bacterium]
MQDKIEKLKKLVTQFKNNITIYKSSNYDEANTRVDFIDKFFELLDWDVRNDEDKSEAYRDVVREDKVEIEGKQKAPDYSFRIGGVRKFFVEAKKPSVNIKEDIDPSFQVRRYGYTAKLPLSILTDFEEFAIYDTRIKPAQTDKSSVARVFYCNYEEYEKYFDFIYNTFSKKAIEKGSFDKYIVENKNKKGTTEIDKDFLDLINGWRNELARNIALRNSTINIHELNYAVQIIIDRLIFLRIAEDRNIENYGMLQEAAAKPEIYKTLTAIFKKADEKYNSNLFKVNDLIINLDVDDKILKAIIKTLYYPDCPYEFSILGIEILGNIYEQFLGKTIRLTEGHQAKVEEKPEVRKAGGVYYTPQYIVDYIVENTIGNMLNRRLLVPSSTEGKSSVQKELPMTPDEISGNNGLKPIAILDPACGSGSFLLGAYDYLLKYHLNYWTNDKNIKKALKEEKIYKLHENHYKLTIEEKQKILTNNIYGVDIDNQAVEVTKLSLLLKLLEDENKESSVSLFKHSDLKLLPNLENNIKCGNSLIGSDFYTTGS